MEDQEVKTEKHIKRLAPTAMRSNGADYVRSTHHVVVPPDYTLEDILTPRFWSHHFNALNVFDLVDVVASDFSLDVTLRVVEKGVGFVTMLPLRVYQREQAKGADKSVKTAKESELEPPEGYVVNHAPKTGWRFFTTNPHQEIARGFKSKHEATLAAIEHDKKASGQAA